MVLGAAERNAQVAEGALLVQLLQLAAVDVVLILTTAPKVQVAGASAWLLDLCDETMQRVNTQLTGTHVRVHCVSINTFTVAHDQ
eukprot:1160053-Pelagomonas_calceolata.AAC.12